MTTIDRYGVMGYPVSHSRSPVIHRLFALQTGQDMQYELLQVAPDKLETAVRQFQRTGTGPGRWRRWRRSVTPAAPKRRACAGSSAGTSPCPAIPAGVWVDRRVASIALLKKMGMRKEAHHIQSI